MEKGEVQEMKMKGIIEHSIPCPCEEAEDLQREGEMQSQRIIEKYTARRQKKKKKIFWLLSMFGGSSCLLHREERRRISPRIQSAS